MQEEGQGFQKFLTAYFDFLEKGILYTKRYRPRTNRFRRWGRKSSRERTFDPSPLSKSKFYEQDTLGNVQTGSWEIGEYVVGSTSGATARIDVIGETSNKLYVEVFTESQFLPDETIVGQNSGYTAKTDSFEGGAFSLQTIY